MANRLTDMVLDEVSLVDEPANKKARVAYFKRGGTMADKNPLTEVLKSLLTPFAKNLPKEDQESFHKSLDQLEAAASEESDTMPDELKLSDVEKAFYNGLNAEDKAKFEKMDTAGRAEFIKAAEGNEADVNKRGAQADVLTISKADLDAAISAAVAKSTEVASTRIENLEKALRQRDSEAVINKLASDLSTSNVSNAPTIAKTLAKVTDDEVREELVNAFKAAGEQLKTAGIFMRKSVSGDGDAGDPVARFEKAVDEIAKAKNISKSKATSEVYNDPANAELVNEYNAAVKQR